jgi:hypothetical protein
MATPRSNRKARNLVDDAGALSDQPFAHPVQRLQAELIGRFGGTNVMVGRCTASAIASASRKSFFWMPSS